MSGCNNMASIGSKNRIKSGSKVRLHLEMLLQDGTEALSTFGEEPLVLRIGDGTLAPGLEKLLLGLPSKANERFLANGDDLYGPRVSEKVHWLELSAFPSDLAPTPGQVVAFDTPGGQETAGVVLGVEDDRVQVDFNHPLAGRSLHIRVQILDVSEPDSKQENT